MFLRQLLDNIWEMKWNDLRCLLLLCFKAWNLMVILPRALSSACLTLVRNSSPQAYRFCLGKYLIHKKDKEFIAVPEYAFSSWHRDVLIFHDWDLVKSGLRVSGIQSHLSITSVALKYVIQLILCLQGLQLCSGYLLITNKTIVVKEQGNR